MRAFFALLGSLTLASIWPAIPTQSGLFPPGSDYLTGVVGRPQSLPLDCEARSAADWAAYWGIDVEEQTFFQQLPKSDNPETGFVGDVYDAPGFLPPRGYGVYAQPIATLLRAYGLSAEAEHDASALQLESEVASGRPVIVWFLYGCQVRTPVHMTARDGQTYVAAPFEHTGILIGYDPDSFTLVEAFSGRVERVARDTFLASWATLGNQAVFGGRSGGPTLSKPSDRPPASLYTVQRGDTLGQIARQFGLNWRELARANGLPAPYLIYPGQRLQLGQSASLLVAQPPSPSKVPPQNTNPPQAVPVGVYVVERGDTLAEIAGHFGLSWITLAGLNGISWPYTIYPGQQLSLRGVSPGSSAVHVVGRGESLSSIAQATGMPWPRLALLNGLLPPYTLYPGQVIRLRWGREAGLRRLPDRALTKPNRLRWPGPTQRIDIARHMKYNLARQRTSRGARASG